MPRIISFFQDDAGNDTLNVKATAGLVYSVMFQNLNLTLVRYYQLHDTATTPSNGAVPKVNIRASALAVIVLGTDFFTEEGVTFANGIAFAVSTTPLTLTLGVAGDQQSRIVYS